jgi:hypothetical protein
MQQTAAFGLGHSQSHLDSPPWQGGRHWAAVRNVPWTGPAEKLGEKCVKLQMSPGMNIAKKYDH